MTILLLAAAATASPVVVSSLTTAQLAAQCRADDANADATFCTGYILGVFDALSRTRTICPKADRASTAEVVAAARKYLRKNKKAWGGAPSFVVRDALRGAFPCKKK